MVLSLPVFLCISFCIAGDTGHHHQHHLTGPDAVAGRMASALASGYRTVTASLQSYLRLGSGVSFVLAGLCAFLEQVIGPAYKALRQSLGEAKALLAAAGLLCLVLWFVASSGSGLLLAGGLGTGLLGAFFLWQHLRPSGQKDGDNADGDGKTESA